MALYFLNSLKLHRQVKKSIYEFALLKKKESLRDKPRAERKMLLESYSLEISQYAQKGSDFCEDQM